MDLPKPNKTGLNRKRWKAAARQAASLMEILNLEMREYADSRSDRWHDSATGQDFGETIDDLELAKEQFTEFIDRSL